MVILLIFIIPCIEILQLLFVQSQFGDKFHPAFAFFLAGSSRGHATQTILLWFLPIFFLIIHTEDSIEDYNSGYSHLLINKIGIKKYCLEKLGSSFIVAFTIMLSSLLLNFLLVCFIFANGDYDRGLSEAGVTGNALFTFGINHPFLTDIFFMIICSILAGFSGVIGASVSLLFNDRKYAYTAAFVIWFMLVLKKESIMFLIQPFSEYGIDTLAPIFLFALAVFLIVSLIAYIYRVKYYEN